MIKLLEFFGGIGSPRRALSNVLDRIDVPIKSIDYVEILPSAVDAYNAMFPYLHTPQDIITWNHRVDILVHGSPCQDWSKNGNNDVNTGRSILYQATLDKIENELSPRPKVVLWENVPNLVHRHREHFDHYLNALESYGYTNYWEIIDSKNHGLPQSRPRVYVVSIRNDVHDQMPAPFDFPAGNIPLDDIRDYIQTDLSDDEFNDHSISSAEQELFIHDPYHNEVWVKENTKAGKSMLNEYDVINVEFPTSKTRRGRIGRQMTKTILTKPRQAIYYDGKVRLLTSLEITRLMGFDDSDYHKLKEVGILDSRIKFLMGNSIAVPVLEHIFQELINQKALIIEEDNLTCQE